MLEMITVPVTTFAFQYAPELLSAITIAAVNNRRNLGRKAGTFFLATANLCKIYPKAAGSIAITTDLGLYGLTNKSIIVGPAFSSVVSLFKPSVKPLLITAGEELATVAEEAAAGAVAGTGSGIQQVVSHLPDHIEKGWDSFKPKEDAKDPIIESLKEFIKSFKGLEKPIITTAVLTPIAITAFSHYRKNGTKTTKDKVIAATGVTSASGALVGIFSLKTLSQAMDLSWDAIKRTALPISMGAVATKCFADSYKEGLNSNKGKTQAAYGVTALAGSVMSAVFLNR